MASKAALLHVYGDSTSECNYCNTDSNGRWSFRVTCDSMSAAHYQAMIDRGWRRSGTLMYQPCNNKACCPQYTIRLDTTKFTPTKSQRKVQNKMNRFLEGGHTGITASTKHEDRHPSLPIMSKIAGEMQEMISKVAHELFPDQKPVVRLERSKKTSEGQISCPVALQIAGVLKKQNKSTSPDEIAQQLISKLTLPDYVQSSSVTHGFMNFSLQDSVLVNQDVEMGSKSVSTESGKRSKSITEQGRGTGADSTITSAGTENTSSSAHRLQVKLVPARFRKESFEVYKRYQQVIHHDDPSELNAESYKHFLVENPFPPVEKEQLPGQEIVYGGYHMEYRLDGKLIAVGVVDLLPKCLSSVYFYYDPDYHHLSLGVYSAMREIEWVQTQAYPRDPNLRFYYLGYYIHNCQKMKYKAEYGPADLLCPVTYTWHPFDHVKKLFDQKKFVCFQDPEHTEEVQAQLEEQWKTRVTQVRVVSPDGKHMTLLEMMKAYRMAPQFLRVIQRYVIALGPENATDGNFELDFSN
eukprot:TRINITY_DN18565_c0_g1::TRINITY_DN18565_c0_g1_i1::g.1131::m.1131 TRINITY_DN18565_c0_g1::TRINITY_DN18565_c0_g1_i1::g.1131  ORF type:complete len:522 (+),score=81.91,sp/Q9ZT48/ATE1_ARATH/34.19/4e-86,ATE_C/PF04377.10/1.3e-46,ATE_N/PF04376.8/1.5e-21,Arg_tRNA_synt_N/PF03485.11/2.7e-11,Acetyltransf_6/PF13480.1/4.6e+03,Acetyltransf_6/PF13480.1/0.022,Acetyltransf_6/PF13480.1/69 TRINITY_DN18565_c0_g1_i1:71-1636(+)